MSIELRTFDFEIRADDPEEMRVEGYAAVFNQLSVPLGCFGWRERINPSAFAESLADSGHDIYALWNHNSDMPLASRDSGTLSLKEDEQGLFFSMLLNGTDWGESAFRTIRSKVVKKMSFGFQTLDDDWSIVDGQEVRNLKKAHLIEVSPVVFPAYPATSVDARSHDEIFARHKGASIEELRTPPPAQPNLTSLLADEQRRLRLAIASRA